MTARAFIRAQCRGSSLPKEITDKAQFEKLLETASEVRVARNGDRAKVKLRTKEALYTFRTTAEEADVMIKGIKAPVIEF
jgi:Ribosomal L38e protein family